MGKKLLYSLFVIVTTVCLAFGVSACDGCSSNGGSSDSGTDLSQIEGESDSESNSNDDSSPDGGVHMHSLVAFEAKAATCTAEGNFAYWQCSECGKCFSDKNGVNEITLSATIIKAMGHDYDVSGVVWEWDGYTSATAKFTCKNDNSHTETITAEISSEITTDATCTAKGVRVYTATVTFEGKIYKNQITDGIDKIEHSLVKIAAREATCMEDGNIEYWICSACGKYFSDSESLTEIELSSTVIPATGHSWNDGEMTIEPTCTKTGVIKYTCTDCGDTFTDTISETGHTIGKNGYCVDCEKYLYSAGLSYTLSEDETYYTVSGIGTCTDTYIVIPSTYNNLPVTAIDEMAFDDQLQIIGIYIPDSITTIENYAFYGCYKLVEVYNMSSLEINAGSTENGYVGCYAKNIYNSTDGESHILTQFGYKFVYDSKNNYYLVGYTGTDTELELPTLKVNGTTVNYSVYQYAFYRNTSIKSVTIPDSMTDIGSYAFYGCNSLDGVYVKDISAWCGISFSNEYSNPLYYASNLYLYDSTVQEYELATELEISDDVENISDYAFCNCTSIKNVSIANSVEGIGTYAFSGCTSLTSVEIADGVTSIGNSAFYGCTALDSVDIPDSVTSIGNSAFANCTSLISITIGNGVATLGSSVFSGCRALEKVLMGKAITSVGSNAFNECVSLTGVYITDIAAWCSISFSNVTANPLYYAGYLYRNNMLVTDLIIPEDVTSIGKFAFYNCVSLESVTISDSVTSIGNSAFYGCETLKMVYITDLNNWCKISFGDNYSGYLMYYADNLYLNYSIIGGDIELSDGITAIPYGTFKNSKISNITMPDSLKTIGDYAFFNCDSFIEITIPDGVTKIGSYAFYGSDSATAFTIGSSVRSIGSYAFAYCTELTEVYFNATEMDDLSSDDDVFLFIGRWADTVNITIGANVTKIPAYLFGNYLGYTSYITSIEFEEGSVCKSIGDSAFSGCTELKSFSIPDGVKSIGEYAFSRCTSLTSITISDSVTTIGDSAFGMCYALGEVVIPDSVTSIGSSAFRDCTSMATLTLGKGIVTIESMAFCRCGNLKTVNFNAISMDDLSYNSRIFYYAGSSVTGMVVTVGENVKKIPAYLFADNFSIVSVTFKTNSVCASIGEFAFEDCDSLSEVTFYGALIVIDSYAFSGCTALANITIPDSVSTIGQYAFSDCSLLTSITIPANVTSIGYCAFENCTSLTEINFNATAMDDSSSSPFCYAGQNGDGITVTIGANVTRIPAYLFYSPLYYWSAYDFTLNIVSVEFEENSVCTSIGESAFENCDSIKNLEISDSVIFVGESAFDGCGSLEYYTYENGYYLGNQDNNCVILMKVIDDSVSSFTLNKNVNVIYEQAFADCSSLKNVYITDLNDWCNIYFCDDSANPMCYAENLCLNNEAITGDIVLSDGVAAIPYGTFKNSNITSISIPDSVTTIESYAFYNCTSLESVTMDNSVTTIGGYVFYDCNSLVSITLSDSIGSIGVYSFYNCSSLEAIIVPDSATSIGSYSFSDCSSLVSITIPDSVTSIGWYAFYNCTSLTSVYYTGTASQWASISFSFYYYYSYANPLYYAHNLYLNGTLATNITLENITTINAYAFRYCTSLTSVTIGNSVISIDTYAFYGCSSLTSVTIPDSVTSIGTYAFSGCTLLESVYYGGTASQWASISFDSYSDNPLCYAGNLYLNGELATDITLEIITDVNAYAFYGCTSLTSITIPDGVTSIGDYAFYGCTSLESITIPDSVTSIGDYAFYGCSSLESIAIPDSVTSIGSCAFYKCSLLTGVYYSGTASEWTSISFSDYTANPLYYAGNLYLDGTLATDITIENISDITTYAFYNCTSLESVTISGSVTSICDYAFAYCASLESITISGSVTSISDYTFYKCTSLIGITLPDSITSIGNYAFDYCTSLISVTV